jgi:4-amino-4-deoxy-L-arabinose transferase-like glycosyltransferase
MADRMGHRMGHPVWTTGVAVILAAFYFATSLYIASHRLFWIDELFTVHIARLPHWATIWQALAHGVDSQPPPYYMVVRMSDKLLGPRELAARLPSALAMAAGLLITFDCARRQTAGLYGLIALSVLTCSFLPYYGYEARPYALFFMLSALALWIWTCTSYHSKWGAVGFGAVLGLGVTMHYYAALCLVPYALWEALRWKPWRRPSPKLIAGVIGIAVPAAALLPLVLSFAHEFATRAVAAGATSDPTAGHSSPFWTLLGTFSELFPDGLFLLALIVIWIVLLRAEDKRTDLPPAPDGEAVGWLFLSLPLAGFLMAVLKTHAFVPRYFVGALPGVAVAFASYTWRHFRNSRRAAVGVFLLLATWGVAQQALTVRDPEPTTRASQKRTRQYMAREDSLWKDGKQFVLFPNLPLYLDSVYYSRRPSACFLLTGQGGFIQAVGQSLSVYHPMQFWTLDDLKSHARETAVIEPTPDELELLKQAGLQIEVRYPKPLDVVYVH